MQSETEFEFWKKVSGSSEPPPWHSRFERMVRYIRPSDRVLDFGCGNQYLRTFLQPENTYQGIDCIPEFGRGVFVCDYNQKFDLPSFSPTVLFFGGFFEYIFDVKTFLLNFRKQFPGVYCIFSYAWFPSENRSENHWVNYLGDKDDALVFFGEHLNGLRHVDDWSDHTHQMICVGALKPMQ